MARGVRVIGWAILVGIETADTPVTVYGGSGGSLQ
jgi:hypothetical protein